MRSLLIAALAPLLPMTACAGPNGEGAGSVVGDEEPKVQPEGSYEAAQGAMSDYDVEEAFKELHPNVVRCLEKGTARVEALGGELTLVLLVAPDGKTLQAYLSLSTLGNRGTEECVLSAARARRWPRPVGGNGTAEHTYVVDAAVEATALDARRMGYVKGRVHREIARCAKQVRGRWMVTLYVRGNGNVASVGVATPDAETDEHAECIADRVGQLRVPRLPRRWSKVTFEIP
jgi:hypothetical protein